MSESCLPNPPPSRVARSRRLSALVILAPLGLVLTACSSDDDADTSATTPSTTTTAPGAGGTGGEASDGTIVAVDFTLSDITVAPGAEIVFENQDSTTHTATADDGEFDLGRVEAGQASEPGTAPDEPGSYGFHCEIHPSMTATLTVEG